MVPEKLYSNSSVYKDSEDTLKILLRESVVSEEYFSSEFLFVKDSSGLILFFVVGFASENN